MKKVIAVLLSVIFYSCAGYRITKFSEKSVQLGISKEFIMDKFGPPFKVEKSQSIETLYYKEAVDASGYTYILTTSLIFENSVLIKMEQKEEIPDKVKIEHK